jgi:hypothetical protein
MNCAPIALFVYKRPQHTRQTLEALMQCPGFEQSLLYVFCDGARQPREQSAVEQTRAVVQAMVGDRAIIRKANHNQGLANSIITGITQLFTQHERLIILEDDLLVSPAFLHYMNAGLEFYHDVPSVMQLSGYMFPLPALAQRKTSITLPMVTSWGWATWKRAWQCFDPHATGWEILQTQPQLRFRFNLDGHYDYFSLLKFHQQGQIDSWFVRWYWTVFRQRGYAIFPPVSYVRNMGLDGSGTHSSKLAKLLFPPSPHPLATNSIQFSSTIEVDQLAYQQVKTRFFTSGDHLRIQLGLLKRRFAL